MRLTTQQRDLLKAMRGGDTLKSHRDLDGKKLLLLHPLQGESRPVSPALVESLRDLGLIQSNLKFPTATYVLTDKAHQAIEGS